AWLEAATALLRSDDPLAMATLVEVEGSAPLDVGASMLIAAGGAVEGSLAGGCIEAAVVEEALQALAGAAPRVVTYGISDELAGGVGLMCGGTVHIFIRRVTEEVRSVVLAASEAALAGRRTGIATVLDGSAAGAALAVIEEERIGGFREAHAL